MSKTKALAAAHAAALARLEMAVMRLAGDKDITDRAATLAELREAQDEVAKAGAELRVLKAKAA